MMSPKSAHNAGLPSVFELDPAPILHAQVIRRARIGTPLQAERRLMLAVLQDAVRTLQKHPEAHNPKRRRLVSQTARWVASDDIGWPFSFVNICDALGLHPGQLRSSLVPVRQRSVRERAPEHRLNARPARESPPGGSSPPAAHRGR